MKLCHSRSLVASHFNKASDGVPSQHLQFVSSSQILELSEEKSIGPSLSGRLAQQPIYPCEDTSMQRAQTYSALTYHYLSSFPVWPAIILSQLSLPHD